MAQELQSDELWGLIEALRPPPRPRPKGGRRPVPHRAALTGIIFVLKSGIPWEMLPQEMGCGSGMTCWRRLRAWQRAGVWHKLHHVLLNKLGQTEQIDWSRAAIDAASVAAPGGAIKPARIQRIAANRARNAILWSTAKAAPWP